MPHPAFPKAADVAGPVPPTLSFSSVVTHNQVVIGQNWIGGNMVEVRPREAVILAADFSALVSWYQEVLGFKVARLFQEDFHYCNLETRSGFKIGIADAKEMGVVPADRACNTVVLQFEVDDVQEFFEHLKPTGASIANGPSFDKKGNFWFGGFLDPEGNPCWVVDKNCPTPF